MTEKTIGGLLREGRVKKQLSLDDVEQLTAIPPHHLLAIELDQLNLLPADKREDYLRKYAQAVDADMGQILALYHVEASDKPAPTKSEKVEQPQAAPARVAAAEKSAAQPLPQKEKKLRVDQPKVEKVSKIDDLDAVEVVGSRVSRHQYDTDKPSYVSVILLCLVAVAILFFVGITSWNKLKSGKTAAIPSHSVVKKNQNSSPSVTSNNSSEASSSQVDLTVEGAGANLTATLTHASQPVEVTISLSGAESSWVSVSGSAEGEAGVTLSAERSSYTATLPEGTQSSLITLGITQGVDITVNGEKVDLTALSSTATSYITLNIQ